MLHNGVNYKGLYGNLRTCFGIENKWHELNKMAYLVSLISCQCLCAVFWPFQRDSVGFRFAVFLSVFLSRSRSNKGLYFNHIAWATCASNRNCHKV